MSMDSRQQDKQPAVRIYVGGPGFNGREPDELDNEKWNGNAGECEEPRSETPYERAGLPY